MVFLGKRADLPQQHRVAGLPEDVADAVALAPGHRLGAAVMAVAAHHDVDRRPPGADAADSMARYLSQLRPIRYLAGAQNDDNGLPVVASARSRRAGFSSRLIVG